MPDGASGMAAPVLVREDRGAVATLTLNRPAARNGLSLALLDALSAALRDIATNSGLRCVVIQAEGPVFCAGHDLKEITAHFADADGGHAFFADSMARCAAVMQAIPAVPQPVIAAVQGMATAAGCQLAAACDMVLAAEEARFCTPGVEIGLFCSTPAVALSRAVPRKAAMEMLLTAEPIDAAEARRIGLVNRILPGASLRAEAAALAARIAGRSALAVQLGKRNFHRQAGLPLAEAYEVAAAAMVENLLAEDAAEGIGAFLGKRAPEWRHR
ncbi:Enoyl-CoA hydratase/carnithine racemase [Roseomonas rosea]|uniref:Enoyl-CoA hydratase domain-containing protein 3, mitochondrial n=1 Tax=Muricoccus roseus TaxID=198092 RepID=A0A1M6APV6_9PROT|nr:enoyl-CoA hydratase [Roseomonas rosea]SHI38530.1 Enoyl-CoA hydratase/carnithine racemase [Roseomonas rosea]